ncbi:MAG TPA: dihydrolipoamide acetyltransferase family protein [Anaerolineae bacterium]|nr:dihydrolipoamide acetyltransferase family protein [Anaerolineae bacterium]HOQ98589.1 dihydrolipoamide acetyltransferase family protein [Anaerolineae bacterium]HPL29424.1 dihydrolipoamide acetyltransferase family protein [Anaerolineae bacterium]
MIREVILPQLGETMNEGTIVRWLVHEGDTVQKGDVLFQFETDKAVLDAEAPAAGRLLKILQPQGARVPVLAVVGFIGEPGDVLPSPSGGQIVGCALHPIGAAARSGATSLSPAVGEGTGVRAPRTFASPRARRAARERGLDLAGVTGSGPGGRIIQADVLAFAGAQPRATPLARKAAAEAGVDLSTLAGSGPGGRIVRADVDQAGAVEAAAAPVAATPGEIIPMAGVRARIAERMAASARETACVTLTSDVDATRLVELRTRLKDAYAEALGYAIGYNDLLIAICARALREHPLVNSRLEGDSIRMIEEVHVGLAVDTERGLLVPVVRHADRLGVAEIARTVRDLVARAREGRSGPDELKGGTFTITNLGAYGIDAFTPIINLPECAILGVGRIAPQPAVVDGEIAVRQHLWLSLTFDHRLVDGAPAARFLQRIARLIAEPYLLLA